MYIPKHTRSFSAVGMAVLFAVGAWAWAVERSGALARVRAEKLALEAEYAAGLADVAESEALRQRLETLRKERVVWQGKLAQKGQEGPRLINTAVRLAALSGSEMTGTAEEPVPDPLLQEAVQAAGLHVVTYRVAFRGTYAALVKLFQRMETCDLLHRILSLELVDSQENPDKSLLEVRILIAFLSTDQKEGGINETGRP